MWRVVSKLNKCKHGFKGVQLQRGKIIKFGRYVYKINEISTQPFSTDAKIGENTEIEIEADNATRVKVTDTLRPYDEGPSEHKLVDSKDFDRSKIRKSTQLHPISEEGTKDST